ncbi:hypothetical protein BHM03_00022120 [Ensete ventricosum]|nr:hypothetical protein BHM03_00022120 [Ensete ventricosum]
MRCDFRGCRWRRLLQGCNYNKRKTGQRCTRLLQRRAVVVKLAGNTPGDRLKKTRRLAARMLEAAGLAGVAARLAL